MASCGSLHPPVCLSNFWDRDLPNDLASRMDPRRAVGFFSLLSFLLVVKIETFKFLTC